MTDIATAPTAEQIAAARALVAQADADAAAERRAKEEAATQAIKDLVASPEFKAFHEKAEAVLALAFKNTELGYAVSMLDRLASSFAG